MGKRDQFAAAVGNRVPVGPGNGLPLRGKSPASMTKQTGVKKLPLKKGK